MNTQQRLDELSRQVALLEVRVGMLAKICYQQRVITTFLLNNFSTVGFVYTPPSTVALLDGSATTVHFAPPSAIKAPSLKKMYDHTIISSSLVA